MVERSSEAEKPFEGTAAADTLEGSGLRQSQQKPVLPVDELPTLGRCVADKYKIEQLLAQGGMGAVYSASHVVSGKRVAIKWMLPALSQVPDAAERFTREARATARIDHPNVVDVYDVGRDGLSVFLVMEFLVGETLHARMQRSRVPTQHAVALLMPALRGVAAAHEHGVIHRDLKPDNIFLCQGPHGEPREPKVLDFGISKISNSEHVRDNGLTQTGMVMGTPYYMSPEQVRGARQADERSDVYAFGVILYELLAGQRPFQAETYNQLILKIATEDAPHLEDLNPEVHQELADVVRRAMSRDPEARYASIEQLAVALEPFASGATFRLMSSIPGELGPPRSSTPITGSPALAGVRTPSQAHKLPPSAASTPTPAPAPAQPLKKRWLFAGLMLGLVLGALGLWRFGLAKQERAVNVVRPASAERAASIEAESPPPAAHTQAMNAPAVAPDKPSTEAPSQAPSAQLPVAVSPDVAAVEQRKSASARPAKTQSRPGSTPPLAADWDERLPLVNAPGDAKPAPAASPAGGLSADDLR